jgi:hypothetical protein
VSCKPSPAFRANRAAQLWSIASLASLSHRDRYQKRRTPYGANLLDVCPTLLHLFGLPVGEDMDGKVLLDIYKHRPAAIERIPTWDEVKGDHGMHPPDKQISPADSKAAIQQLVALGYIAEPNTGKTAALEETVRELDYNFAQSYMDGAL